MPEYVERVSHWEYNVSVSNSRLVCVWRRSLGNETLHNDYCCVHRRPLEFVYANFFLTYQYHSLLFKRTLFGYWINVKKLKTITISIDNRHFSCCGEFGTHDSSMYVTVPYLSSRYSEHLVNFQDRFRTQTMPLTRCKQLPGPLDSCRTRSKQLLGPLDSWRTRSKQLPGPLDSCRTRSKQLPGPLDGCRTRSKQLPGL